jgi:hypothetical protein
VFLLELDPCQVSRRTIAVYGYGYIVVHFFLMNADKIRRLERQIAKIKRELVALGDLRIGSLSQQYNVCNSPGCHCKASPPRKHGPYYQISYTRKGMSTTRAVHRGKVTEIRRQLRNYAKLRDLVERWIDAATELSALKSAQEPPKSR